MDQIKITMPIFALIGIGFLARVLIKSQDWTTHLNRFVYYISLPALIIYYFSRIEFGQNTLRIVIVNGAVLLLSACILLPICRALRVNKQLQASFFLTSLVSNSIYLGIPLAQRAYTTEDVASTIAVSSVIQLVGGILLSVVAIEYFFIKSYDHVSVFKHVVINPLFIGVIVGVAFSLFSESSWYSSTLDVPVKMLAGTASPVALFALGSFLYGHTLHKKISLVTFSVVFKILLFPLVALLIASFTKTDPKDTVITTLMCAMPTAVTAFVIAQKYKLDSLFVANVMLLSTVLSTISAPLWLRFVS